MPPPTRRAPRRGCDGVQRGPLRTMSLCASARRRCCGAASAAGTARYPRYQGRLRRRRRWSACLRADRRRVRQAQLLSARAHDRRRGDGARATTRQARRRAAPSRTLRRQPRGSDAAARLAARARASDEASSRSASTTQASWADGPPAGSPPPLTAPGFATPPRIELLHRQRGADYFPRTNMLLLPLYFFPTFSPTSCPSPRRTPLAARCARPVPMLCVC